MTTAHLPHAIQHRDTLLALTVMEAALGILKGVAANERIIILMEYDLNSAKYGFLPEYGEQMDAHVLNVARQRRSGNFKAV